MNKRRVNHIYTIFAYNAQKEDAMATGNNGFFGGFKGKIGNLVFYQMHGKTVVRTRPSVKRKPAKGKLKESQDGFSVVVKCMSQCKEVLRFGFAGHAAGGSAYHSALSQNLNHFRIAENPLQQYWLRLSTGTLAQADQWKLTQTEVSNCALEWSPASTQNAKTTDRLLLFFVPESNAPAQMLMSSFQREQGNAVISIPHFDAAAVAVYAAFVQMEYLASHNPACISESVFVGKLTTSG
jgi:hypothetical protein